MKIRSILTAMVLSVALAGCAANGGQYGNKQLGGTLVGAGLGGLLGSQFGGGTGKLVATGAGVFLGGLIGNSVGQSLDRVDRLSIRQSTQVALERAPVGQPTVWQNPNHRARSVVTPTRTYRAQGRYCREYQQDITVGGKTERAYGRACRNPDGTWQVVNDQSSSAAPVYRPAPVYSQPAPVYQQRQRYRNIQRRRQIFSTKQSCYDGRYC